MAVNTEQENWGQRNSICKDLEAGKSSCYEICITGGHDALQSPSYRGMQDQLCAREAWVSLRTNSCHPRGLTKGVTYVHYTLGWSPESPSKFPPLLPSLLFCLLPDLPLHLPRFWFQPAATMVGQAQDTLCPFGLRSLHLGEITVDLCIPQNEAPTRQLHLSLVNTHYPESLNCDA